MQTRSIVAAGAVLLASVLSVGTSRPPLPSVQDADDERFEVAPGPGRTVVVRVSLVSGGAVVASESSVTFSVEPAVDPDASTIFAGAPVLLTVRQRGEQAILGEAVLEEGREYASLSLPAFTDCGDGCATNDTFNVTVTSEGAEPVMVKLVGIARAAFEDEEAPGNSVKVDVEVPSIE